MDDSSTPEPADPGNALAIIVERPVSLPPDRNPYLVYVGGLDRASQPTMSSTAKLVATVLSSGKIEDPANFPWHQLSYGVVKRARSLLREKGFAPRSVNKALTLMRSVMKEAWLLKLLPHEEYQAVLEVENIKSQQLPAGRVVERDEIANLLLVCQGDPENVNGLRDAALISILVGAGLREKEAVKLCRKDYDEDTGVIRVLFGKGHKQREAYLELAFEAPLRRLLALIPGNANDPIIPRLAPCGSVIIPLRSITTQAVHLILERRAIEAGITQLNSKNEIEASCTPHDLRRTFITTQLEKGVDPLRLARAVGHASPKTTMIYDRRTAESDRIAIRGCKKTKGVDDDC